MSHQRKHLKQEALNADEGSLPGEGEAILRVVRLCGSNLLEAELPNGTATLCRIPQKFNKMLWIKPGSFLVALLGDSDDKVNGEVTRVLYKDHIKRFKKEPGLWPPEFDIEEETAEPSTREAAAEDRSEDSDDDLPPLEANTNQRRVFVEDSSSDDDDE